MLPYLVVTGTTVLTPVLGVLTGITLLPTPTTTSGRVSSVTLKNNKFLDNWIHHYQKINQKWSAKSTSFGEYITRSDRTLSKVIEQRSRFFFD